MLYYWFLFNLYIIRIPFVESVTAVSDSQQLDNNVIELNETQVAIDNHLLPVNKIDKCKICVVFLEDLKLVINGTASPVVSQVQSNQISKQRKHVSKIGESFNERLGNGVGRSVDFPVENVLEKMWETSIHLDGVKVMNR
ncbi:Uncharacterized protein BM_BM10854 [Brugia malayi]|uniref:Bm10854 n=1 Tax=Brugia malayi TaxID=6279 RepID=A0A0K0IPR7_BRUMA|nr:Uncharacterized protein BM_BM10854 [Brugia malayi]CRZ25674.1 Bm10854 [Brugia malayi]VIO91499.1 Uncharacterized protein BM_BM10854 [Brugia malayi]